mmetsp:Transcript_115825/g.327668  ORF Transcript_115825/g.327668 Transcript_115825/m.327668 type:complete len:230 (+) Transcript_115825:1509-2198(+)
MSVSRKHTSLAVLRSAFVKYRQHADFPTPLAPMTTNALRCDWHEPLSPPSAAWNARNWSTRLGQDLCAQSRGRPSGASIAARACDSASARTQVWQRIGARPGTRTQSTVGQSCPSRNCRTSSPSSAAARSASDCAKSSRARRSFGTRTRGKATQSGATTRWKCAAGRSSAPQMSARPRTTRTSTTPTKVTSSPLLSGNRCSGGPVPLGRGTRRFRIRRDRTCCCGPHGR